MDVEVHLITVQEFNAVLSEWWIGLDDLISSPQHCMT